MGGRGARPGGRGAGAAGEKLRVAGGPGAALRVKREGRGQGVGTLSPRQTPGGEESASVLRDASFLGAEGTCIL